MPASRSTPDALDTLPDYLVPGLELVFVGINPGLLSARRGHYFARGSNRFWRSFSLSCLSVRAREGLGRTLLVPEDDRRLPEFGIGLTDTVKRPTANASELSAVEFAAGAVSLRSRLVACEPRVACFHGVTAYRAFARHALGVPPRAFDLGLQPERLGDIRLFITPSPSPANAHFRPDDYVVWYDCLATYLEDV